MPKYKGFTLAETLITLTIIGVIAVLTVPNLISKYQKHTYVVGLKKAYSELQDAVKMIPITEGCPAEDYECAGFFGDSTNIDGQNFNGHSNTKAVYLLSKQMKVYKFCGENSTIWTNNPKDICYRPNYDYFYYHAYATPRPGFITTGGVLWGVHHFSNLHGVNYVFVDVNGAKGPNKNGIDMFFFAVASTERTVNNTIVPAGTVMPSGGPLFYAYVFGWGQQKVTCPGIYCTWKVLSENAINY